MKERDEDLTREPEMVRAYRDTWTLGTHSYLAYWEIDWLPRRNSWLDRWSVRAKSATKTYTASAPCSMRSSALATSSSQ